MPPKKTVTNPVTTIRGPAYSDGDAGHRPSKANYTRADEEVFMQKVAGRWMEQTGRAQEGEFVVFTSVQSFLLKCLHFHWDLTFVS